MEERLPDWLLNLDRPGPLLARAMQADPIVVE